MGNEKTMGKNKDTQKNNLPGPVRIALVLCPFWGLKLPPVAPALLSAVLKKEKYNTRVFDLNKVFSLKAKRNTRRLWEDYYEIIPNNTFAAEFVRAGNKIIDSAVNEILKFKPAIVCFSLYSSTRELSLKVAKKIKDKNSEINIVFGGPECFYSGEELVKHDFADYVVVGEGEETLPELVKCLSLKTDVSRCPGVWHKKGGQPFYSGNRNSTLDINSIPFPDYSDMVSLYRAKSKTILPLVASRGCFRRCVFCGIVATDKKYRQMSAERMMEHIEYYNNAYGTTEFVFLDNLINGDIKVLDKFCGLVTGFNFDMFVKRRKGKKTNKKFGSIVWSGNAIIRPEMNYRLLKKMKEAGCISLGYGIESGSQAVINKMNKNYLLNTAKTVLRETHEAGIDNQVYMMLGFPTETARDFEKTLNFIKETRPYIDHIVPSTSFCGIVKDSYLQKNPQSFGITNMGHWLYWEAANGKNNYEERVRRFNKLCGLIGKLKIKSRPQLSSMKENTQILLDEYYKYKALQS